MTQKVNFTQSGAQLDRPWILSKIKKMKVAEKIDKLQSQEESQQHDVSSEEEAESENRSQYKAMALAKMFSTANLLDLGDQHFRIETEKSIGINQSIPFLTPRKEFGGPQFMSISRPQQLGGRQMEKKFVDDQNSYSVDSDTGTIVNLSPMKPPTIFQSPESKKHYFNSKRNSIQSIVSEEFAFQEMSDIKDENRKYVRSSFSEYAETNRRITSVNQFQVKVKPRTSNKQDLMFSAKSTKVEQKNFEDGFPKQRLPNGEVEDDQDYRIRRTNNSSMMSKKQDGKNNSDDEGNCMDIEEKISLPSISGFIYKINLAKGTRKRIYATIWNKKLIYYKDQTRRKFLGVLDFDRIQTSVKIVEENDLQYDQFNQPKRFKVDVCGFSKQFMFELGGPSLLRQWMQVLYTNWHASQSFALKNTSEILASGFWKVDHIKESEFRVQADTGDILLFRGQSFATKLQRAITRSEYDHVAMLLRYSNGKLVLFECTGTNGVAVLDWGMFVKNKWNKLYSKLAFRKLKHKRTYDNMQLLEKFIRGSLGMKYKLDPSKLFAGKKSAQQSDEESYFCSELIASAYKAMGLLPLDVISSSYWPGNFSTKSGLELEGDAYLMEEQIIEFL